MSSPGPDRGAAFDTRAAPQNDAERRAFFQDRLALFGRVVTLMSLGFFVLLFVARVVFRREQGLRSIYGWEDVFHFASIVIFGAAWAICRTGELSRARLGLIDGLVTPLGCAAYALMVSNAAGQTGALVVVLCTLTTLLTRAIFVPSAPRSTLLVSSIACLPSIAVTYHDGAMLLRGPVPPGLAAASYVAMWSAVSVGLCTLTTKVIYGLRESVREARQLGQYTLLERIGSGGMGVVYRAEHAMLRRPTAVKVLPPEKAGEQTLRRFEREVQLTARLTHPNTIAIYDYGRTPDGLFYYAMEYLDGFTLSELVEVAGPLPPARVAFIVRQAAGSLAEAHDIGLIHRDIKPDNILISDRGGVCDQVKVVDFGLVKDTHGAADPVLSHVDAIIGTPLYLAPEAVTDATSVGAASDLYALGAVAYFLLVGRHIFSGETMVEICSHHVMTPPTPPSEVLGHPVPAALEALILACLAKKPEQRPESARAVELALSAATDAGWTRSEACAWWQAHRPELERVRRERLERAPATDVQSVTRQSYSAVKSTRWL